MKLCQKSLLSAENLLLALSYDFFLSLTALCLRFLVPTLPSLVFLLLGLVGSILLLRWGTVIFPRRGLASPPFLILSALLVSALGSWGFQPLLNSNFLKLLSSAFRIDRHCVVFFLTFLLGLFSLYFLVPAFSRLVPLFSPSEKKSGSFSLPLLILSLGSLVFLVNSAVFDRTVFLPILLAFGAAALVSALLLYWTRWDLSFLLPRCSPAFFLIAAGAAGILGSGTFYQLFSLPDIGTLSILVDLDIYNVSFFLISLAGMGSVYLLAALFSLLWRVLPGYPSQPAPRQKTHSTFSVFALCGLTAFLFIGICSMCSPLYPLNTWVDSNCYMTLGRGILNGLVPYRDLMDHKGPLIYMLHAAAALIDDTSFLGVYFFEVILGTFFLYYSYRILELLAPGASLAWIFPMAVIVYNSSAFALGDSAEEICLPLLSYALYSGLCGMKENAFLSPRTCFWIGVTSTCVFWIKYTMVGFYLGWFLAFCLLALRRREYAPLLKMVLWILAGMAVVTLPILIYFWAAGALMDFWTVYFYYNLFSYVVQFPVPLPMRILGNMYLGALQSTWNNAPFALLAFFLCALTLAKRRSTSLLSLVLLSWGGLVFLVYAGGILLPYYCLILMIYLPLGISVLIQLIRRLPFFPVHKALQVASLPVAMVLCLLWLNRFGQLSWFRGVSLQDLPQYQFSQIMHQKEDPTLLNYGFLDGGFYLVADILPNCPAFCQTNLPVEKYTSMQDQWIREGRVDFVVTSDTPLEADNYRLVSQQDWSGNTYYLYQLSD